MKNYPTTLDLMLEAWNQTDLSDLRKRLEAFLTSDVEFVDPTTHTHGIDEFEANVYAFRNKYPTAFFQKTSGIDSHHNLHRYGWEMVVDGRVVLQGFDVTETDGNHKIRKVCGFFGPLPPLELQ